MPKTLFSKSIFFSLIVGAAAALSGCTTPGVSASVRGDSARLKEILDKPDRGNEDLDNLLTNSVAFDCVECVRLLLGSGAKPDAEVLSIAALAGHLKAAQLLIAAGADPAAAMAVIHRETRKWVGGEGVSPAQAQTASDLFKKIERENPSRAAAPAPAAYAPVVASTQTPHPPETPSFQEARRPDDYAVIVGLEKYDELPSAPYAERDATAAARFVMALGVPARNVAALTGARATRSGLEKYLEGWLADNIDESSTVYFYYAGHGAPDPKSGLAYLVPFDGDPQYLEQTAYPLKRLYEKLGALKAKRVIVILDAGFSGAGARSVLAKGAQAPSIRVDAGFNSVDGKVALLAAADGDQSSGTNEEKGYGLFTYHMLSGLNGGAKNRAGQVTLKSLFDYLKPKVAEDARRAGRAQVPLFQSGGTATDDVVLRGN
jgi:hypothetical protein